MGPIIEVQDIHFRYDKRTQDYNLSGISFTVNKGEWVSIIGHNGSGKSTLSRLLVGLLTPDLGMIKVNGIELNEETKWEIRTIIGMVFQNPDNQFLGTTVQDDVAFGLENLNIPYEEMKKRVDNVLELVSMTDFREHDPSLLSGGQKQRVAIASALALQSQVIVFDEAFVMLDPKSRTELLQTLRNLNKHYGLTVISITHDMNEASNSDRIIMLEKGKISFIGTPKEAFINYSELTPPLPERLRRVLLEKGRKVPNDYINEEELVQWLWKLN